MSDLEFSVVAGVFPATMSAAPTKRKTKEKPRTSTYEPPAQFWWNQPRDLPAFSFATVQQMLLDGEVRLALAMRAAPLPGIEFGYYEDEDTFIPKVKSPRADVAEWVKRNLERIWRNFLDDILTAQAWGWSAGEVTQRLNTETNQVDVDRVEVRRAADCRLLTFNGDKFGIRVRNVKGAEQGFVDLRFPRAFFHSHAPEPGEAYGRSQLLGAYSPWSDKAMEGGATDVRRLFMYKDSYGGMDLGYPNGETYIQGSNTAVPNRDIARQIAEQAVAGGIVTRPSERDESGNELWPLNRATVASNPTHILEYPKDLDREIRRGVGVPDDVTESEGSGGWAGKRIPMAAFYASLDSWVRSILWDLTAQVFEPLVLLNFGEAAEFEIDFKPLAKQAVEQQGDAGGGEETLPAPQPLDVFQQPGRLSLDPVDAVGSGALEAGAVVDAARTALRMSQDKKPQVGDVKEKNGKRYRLNKNRRWQRIT